MSRIVLFLDRVTSGYEPVLVRTVAAAFFVMLATFGVGSGELPAWAEGLLTFLAILAPAIAGWRARRKVAPVQSGTSLGNG